MPKLVGSSTLGTAWVVSLRSGGESCDIDLVILLKSLLIGDTLGAAGVADVVSADLIMLGSHWQAASVNCSSCCISAAPFSKPTFLMA